jgi:hypothetical protein
MYGYFDAQHMETEALKGEVQKLWASLDEVVNGQRTIAEWAAQTTDRLVQLERAGKITQRDLGLARSAIDNLKRQMAANRTETTKEHKGLGVKTEEVGRKVDTAATAAETHYQAEENRFHATNREVQNAKKEIQLGREELAEEATVLRDQAAQDASVAGLAHDDLMRGQAEAVQKVDDLGVKTQEVGLKVENVKKMTEDEVIKLLNDLLKKHP